MSENKLLSIIVILLIVTIGGCCILENKYRSVVMIEQEKTKQMRMHLQSKIDSLLIIHNKEYGRKR